MLIQLVEWAVLLKAAEWFSQDQTEPKRLRIAVCILKRSIKSVTIQWFLTVRFNFIWSSKYLKADGDYNLVGFFIWTTNFVKSLIDTNADTDFISL